MTAFVTVLDRPAGEIRGSASLVHQEAKKACRRNEERRHVSMLRLRTQSKADFGSEPA